jgi:Raf kinase inhibitor-like YbhB/YbcL family protein
MSTRISGTTGTQGVRSTMARLEVRSPAFKANQPIPAEHAARTEGEGDNVSPPLEWVGTPPGTVEHVLIVDDPDAPTDEPWVHWVLYGIPGTASSIEAGHPTGAATLERLAGARQGKNSWGELGWGGPLPPRGHGTHHYRFRVHALVKQLDLPACATRAEVEEAMAQHIIGTGELVGTYEREGAP